MKAPWTSPQFCVLEYRPRRVDSVGPERKHLILSALFDLDDESDRYRLKIYVDPQWRAFVKEVDRDYIEDLLPDLVEQANHDAEALFKQLCSLGVGPLGTIQVGTAPDTLPDLPMTQHFVQL